MFDGRANISSILNSVCSNTVEGWPAIIAGPFPMITYFDSGHEPEDYKDGESNMDINEFTVDFWEKMDDSGNIVEVHFDTDKALRAAGYYRTMFNRQFEDDTKIQHISTKYTKVEVEDN